MKTVILWGLDITRPKETILMLVFYLMVAITLFAVIRSFVRNGRYRDTIHLKSGTVVRGKIVSETTGESVTIQTKEGSLHTYLMTEIERIGPAGETARTAA